MKKGVPPFLIKILKKKLYKLKKKEYIIAIN